MIFDPITITDKLGRNIILRSAEERDAETILTYLKVTSAETPFLIREPDEVTLTPEQERAFLLSKKESSRDLLLAATVDDNYIGSCSLMSLGNLKRYHHRCDIAIALYQQYCGLGIGDAMLKTVLNVAKQVGYEQAELEVMANNLSAIALYEKHGFQIHGTLPHNMKYADGTYADSLWMMKPL